MTYSIDVINLFIKHVSDNKTIKSFSTDISYGTLCNWNHIYNYNIVNKIPITHRYNFDKTHGLSKQHLYTNDILTFVKNNEGCNLKEISNHINNELAPSTISIMLKKNNITHKKYKTHIIPKSESEIIELRKDYSNTINKNDFINNTISIDETSIKISDVRRFGYSEKGKEINKNIIKHKSTQDRLSCLSAISNDGLIIYKIFKGSVKGIDYMNFIKDNNETFKNKILLQDNARIHHSKIVTEYAIDNNIELQFNSPYSPEFNPIEQLFRQIKNILRSQQEHKELETDIKLAYEKVSQSDIKSYFNNSYNKIEYYQNLN